MQKNAKICRLDCLHDEEALAYYWAEAKLTQKTGEVVDFLAYKAKKQQVRQLADGE